MVPILIAFIGTGVMMSKPVGTIRTETLVTIYVPKSIVMKSKDKRYVFMVHVQPKVFEASERCTGSRKLYNNFVRAGRKCLYNTVMIYGLEAIDIDTPQSSLVSARLQFKVVESEDEVELSTVKEISKRL